MCPSPVRPVRTQRRRARATALTTLRREEIVAAAVKVFSRKGFAAARAEDIARTAKIAKGTLYLYFRSKESLYSAAIAHAVRELQAVSAERIGAASGFAEKLSAAIAVRLHFWAENEELHNLLLTLGREPRHRKQTNELLRSGQDHLMKIFAAGIASRELRKADYAALGWAILDMIRGATERRMDGVMKTAIEVDVEAITSVALRAVGLER